MFMHAVIALTAATAFKGTAPAWLSIVYCQTLTAVVWRQVVRWTPTGMSYSHLKHVWGFFDRQAGVMTWNAMR